ncbi:hypothetical protein FHG87_016635 [Trinorchestia longiramus]|nr:hypothetical protein FHG87_016635 [Trinorchestia longiramus]
MNYRHLNIILLIIVSIFLTVRGKAVPILKPRRCPALKYPTACIGRSIVDNCKDGCELNEICCAVDTCGNLDCVLPYISYHQAPYE